MDNDLFVALQALNNRHPSLSLRKVADLLDVNPGYLSRVANGKREVAGNLADTDHWNSRLTAAGVPASDLEALLAAVARAAASKPRRTSKPSYGQMAAMLRMAEERYATRTSTVGPAGDHFTGRYAAIPISAVAAALEAGLAISADTDDGAMVDAGTVNLAIQTGPLGYYVECRGGGRDHAGTDSPDPRIVAEAFVRFVGGSAAINSVVNAVAKQRS